MSKIQQLEDGAVKVRDFAREIVVHRVGIIAAVVIVLNYAVANHLPGIDAEMSDRIADWVNRGIDIAGLIAAITWTRSGVTPADTDKYQAVNTKGQLLVPAALTSVAQTNAAAPVLVPAPRKEAVAVAGQVPIVLHGDGEDLDRVQLIQKAVADAHAVLDEDAPPQ